MLALVAPHLLSLAIGFMLGYGAREMISRRRHAATVERYRNRRSADTLTGLDWHVGERDGGQHSSELKEFKGKST